MIDKKKRSLPNEIHHQLTIVINQSFKTVCEKNKIDPINDKIKHITIKYVSIDQFLFFRIQWIKMIIINISPT